MRITETTETASFFLELLSLLLKAIGIFGIAYANGSTITITLTHALYKELFDGISLIKLDVLC
jgi:hypothetical protein